MTPQQRATLQQFAAECPAGIVAVVLAYIDALEARVGEQRVLRDQVRALRGALSATAPFGDVTGRACWCRSLAAEDSHHSPVCVQARDALRVGLQW